jgi:hypothetical protein
MTREAWALIIVIGVLVGLPLFMALDRHLTRRWLERRYCEDQSKWE